MLCDNSSKDNCQNLYCTFIHRLRDCFASTNTYFPHRLCCTLYWQHFWAQALIDFGSDYFQELRYIFLRNRIMAAENMKLIWKRTQLLLENLIFLFKQKRRGQGQKFTENTPSVDLANIKLSVMKMQKMLGKLIEGKGCIFLEVNHQHYYIVERDLST